MLVLLTWALKATAVLALAGAVDVLLRHRSAALRHLTWTLALAGTLAMPLASVVAPRWRLPAWAGWKVGSPAGLVSQTAVVDAPATEGSLESMLVELATSTPLPSTGASGSMVTPAAETWDTPSHAPRIPWSVPWTSLVLLTWAVGLALLLARLLHGALQVRRLGRTTRPAAEPGLMEVAGELSRALRVGRPVSIRLGAPGTMPMTWGLMRPVVLLPEDVGTWPRGRLVSVLMHELGHVQRYDCVTQLVASLAVALYWFHPLLWYAAARARIERELACDDLVLAFGSRPSEYAGHLMDVARTLRPERLASVAAIAMARPSHLGRRITAVLDAARGHGLAGRGTVTLGSVIALALMLALGGMRPAHGEAAESTAARWEPPRGASQVAEQSAAAGEAERPPRAVRSPLSALAAEIRDLADLPLRIASAQACDWSADRNTSSSINVNDDAMTVRLRAGDCRLEILSEGEIEFSDDDADVARIARGGFLEIEERQGNVTRRLEVSARNGGLERRWWVNGREAQYDADARAWLARMLPVVFRRTGLDAERRAARILQRGGADALLQETALIPSDWAARQYYTVLLSRPDLDPGTLRRVVQQAGREIASDYELAELLISVARHQTVDENVRLAYVEATGQIQSSYERRRALTAVLTRGGLSAELADAMLQQSVGITSDFEAAELLIEVVGARAPGTPLPAAFWQAVDGIQSSYERRRVLHAVVQRSAGNQVVLDSVLASGAGVKSDYERTELLIAVAQQYPTDRSLPASYVRAVGTMSSGFELRRALDALVKRPGVTAPMLVSVLQAAQNVRGDYERAELLVNVLKGYPLTDAIRQPFFNAAAGIKGDFEHARVLKAVIARGDLDSATVRALLGAAAGIASDYELAEVLVAVARAAPIGEDLRPDFLKAADGIKSDHERGRALNALYRRGTRADD